MAEFYIPKTGTVTVGKTPYRVFRGVHAIPDALANSHEANAYGIKPPNEMTDDEWRLSGLVKATWMKQHMPAPKVAEKAPAAAPKAAPVAPAPAAK